MLDVRRELADEIELSSLSGGAFLWILTKRVHQWFVVGKDDKILCFHHVSKMFDGEVDCQ